MEAFDNIVSILSDYIDEDDQKTLKKLATKYSALGEKILGKNGKNLEKIVTRIIDSNGNYTSRLTKEISSSEKFRELVTKENLSKLSDFLKDKSKDNTITDFLKKNNVALDKVDDFIDKYVNPDFVNKVLDDLGNGDLKATVNKGLNNEDVKALLGDDNIDKIKNFMDKLTPESMKNAVKGLDFDVIKNGVRSFAQGILDSQGSGQNVDDFLKGIVSKHEGSIRGFLSNHKDDIKGLVKDLSGLDDVASGFIKKLSGVGKVAALIGIGTVGIMSGNQARRRERQAALYNGDPSKKKRLNQPPPLMPTQSSEMYHDETMALAQSISQYRYGAKMPGYMT